MKKKLVEADLSGGTVDAENDLVMFDDYPTWVAAAASCGAKVETGQVFTDTASAILNDCLVGEWNDDQGYINTAALDSLLPAINPGDDDDSETLIVAISPDAASPAPISPVVSPAANEEVSFVDILNRESDGLEQFLREAKILDKISEATK